MAVNVINQLKWVRAPGGAWHTNNTAAKYEIAGPLGSYWYVFLPDDTYACFYTKRDAIAHAQEHFEKRRRVVK